ncbi:MAG: hypothetical protein H0W40_13720 [Methylibium sp.]|uniref:hypothetical protein n=1 Tax=Methylibium sp. TaxID=2067992 RepID=UPI00183B196C|nr:hypothetical protein [Methylibium sp.]MBA3598415.1 hypothetical protein [Methylibium sp.]
MRRTIDLAAAIAAAHKHEVQALTLGELVRASSSATLDGSDTRLRKWLAALGDTSAWTAAARWTAAGCKDTLAQGRHPRSR